MPKASASSLKPCLKYRKVRPSISVKASQVGEFDYLRGLEFYMSSIYVNPDDDEIRFYKKDKDGNYYEITDNDEDNAS
jgi:hypothetical protein